MAKETIEDYANKIKKKLDVNPKRNISVPLSFEKAKDLILYFPSQQYEAYIDGYIEKITSNPQDSCSVVIRQREPFIDNFKLVKDLESRLTLENINKVKRYLTKNLMPDMGTGALINITTIHYPGKPYSNSILLHELIEANEFEKLGYNFASKELDIMSNEQREKVKEQWEITLKKNREPHIKAMKMQYEYLSAVAFTRGFKVSAGTALKFSLFHGNKAIDEAIKFDSYLSPRPEEFNDAKEFALAQLSHFGGEIAIFKKSFLRSVSKSPKMLENPAW